MSRRRDRRPPTSEELALWGTVAKTVAPLHPPGNVEDEAGGGEAEMPARIERPIEAEFAHPAKGKTAPPPSLAALDRRTRARVAKGTVGIDARIDLHGLTQQAAHARLRRFLAEAQEEDRRIVLVITGKGRPAPEPGSDDRGVLRRMVPIWLAAPDLRPLVVGFEEAGRGHGGAGALYVRIRRPRSRRD